MDLIKLSSIFYKLARIFDTYKLSEDSIKRLKNAFPKIDDTFLSIISERFEEAMLRNERLKGMHLEHLRTTGLCGSFSNAVFEAIESAYPNVKYVTGFYILDFHPRYHDNDKTPMSYHTWVEIENKIIDFTAEQFNPFLNPENQNHKELEIIDKFSDKASRYKIGYNPDTDIDLGLISRDDYILDWYIDKL